MARIFRSFDSRRFAQSRTGAGPVERLGSAQGGELGERDPLAEARSQDYCERMFWTSCTGTSVPGVAIKLPIERAPSRPRIANVGAFPSVGLTRLHLEGGAGAPRKASKLGSGVRREGNHHPWQRRLHGRYIWLPWLERELTALGIDVIDQTFPDNIQARAAVWLPRLGELGAG